MKRLFWVLVAAFAIYSCTDKLNGTGTVSDPISFSATSFSLDADGRAQSFTVVAPQGEWNASTSASWLHVTPESGSGTVTVSVSADENRMDIERSAYIDFTMPGYFNGIISLTVTQAAGEGDDPGPGPGPGPDPGPGGDTPAPSGLQYLGCYEIPAVSLVSTESCTDSGNETVNSAKWYKYQTTNPDQIIVTHTFPYQGKTYRNYTILVDKNKKASLWNAFVMHSDVYGEDHGVGRSGSWKADPALPSDWQSCFSSSGYSRGHQVASNYRQVNTDANKQTFYYTNQALQYQTQFNDGVWNNLENAVVGNQPGGLDTLYVVVGLLYENERTLDGVPLPSHFYKLLMKCSFSSDGTMTGAKGAAYIFTNEAHPGMSYSAGITTIDAIEERSGFNFFANVPAELQEAAEKNSSSIW